MERTGARWAGSACAHQLEQQGAHYQQVRLPDQAAHGHRPHRKSGFFRLAEGLGAEGWQGRLASRLWLCVPAALIRMRHRSKDSLGAW
eukprot:6196420-Pleurochrysis_carterae.AAC.1